MTVWQASIFLIIAVAAFIGLDIYLATDSIIGNTWSEIIRGADRRHPWFAYVTCFSFGLLVGHWFW